MGLVATTSSLGQPIRLVRGSVTDLTTGQALPGVDVRLAGATKGTSTRADGSYEILVNDTGQQRQLVFSSIGFVTTTQPLGPAETFLTVALEQSCTMLTGEVVVTGATRWYTPRGLWQRLTRPFRR